MSDQLSIGVFGEDLILWIMFLRQSPRRPPADHIHRQVNFMLDELRASPAAQLLPVVSAEDGMFALSALVDEVAMALPEVRPWWSQNMLQARRFNTNNAGVEFYSRLDRVRQAAHGDGIKNVLATYVVVLGCGFLGQYGLPGRDPYLLSQLRAQLARELGVDADRDVMAGVLRPYRYATLPAEYLPKEPFYRSVWMGRGLAIAFLLSASAFLAYALDLYRKTHP